MAVTPFGEIFLAIAAADQARERERLDKEIAKIENELRTVENKIEKQQRLLSALPRQSWTSTGNGWNISARN